MKAELQKRHKPTPSAPQPTRKEPTVPAKKPAAPQPTSSNEAVRLHLLQIAAEAKAQQAQPVAQRQPATPTMPATRWTPPKPSSKTVAAELARIAAEERESK